MFIEPELLNLGEPDALAFDEPAPAPQGEPEESQEQIDKIVTPGESEKPTNATEKLVVSQKKCNLILFKKGLVFRVLFLYLF